MSEGDGISNRSGPASAAEPSMEEILASIRRILSEEEASGAIMPEDEEEVFLDASMRVPVQELHVAASATEPPPPEPESYFTPSSPAPVERFTTEPSLETAEPVMDPEPTAQAESVAVEPMIDLPAPAEPDLVHVAEQPIEEEKEHYMEEQVQAPEGLVDEQAVSDISNSIGALVRSVSAERSSSVGRPGITIEDIVREEVKPVLKAWLDTHLPTLVERVVRAEINRVMDRAQG
ncbi:MAG: DUF2497 domain-containing protein [Rhodospirillales bacterium]|nr:DUF2497 domain-containing protein [Rhodospirillales bacterium]